MTVNGCRIIRRNPVERTRATVQCCIAGCTNTFDVHLGNLRVGTSRRVCDTHKALQKAARKHPDLVTAPSTASMHEEGMPPAQRIADAPYDTFVDRAAMRRAMLHHGLKPPTAYVGRVYGVTLLADLAERTPGGAIKVQSVCLMCGRTSYKWNNQFRNVVHQCSCMNKAQRGVVHEMLDALATAGYDVTDVLVVLKLMYRLDAHWQRIDAANWVARMYHSIEDSMKQMILYYQPAVDDVHHAVFNTVVADLNPWAVRAGETHRDFNARMMKQIVDYQTGKGGGLPPPPAVMPVHPDQPVFKPVEVTTLEKVAESDTDDFDLNAYIAEQEALKRASK